MGFAEELDKLDPVLMDQAYANVSERLLAIAEHRGDFAQQATAIFDELREASPGFMAIIEKYEESAGLIDEMNESLPSLQMGQERFLMTEMMLGTLSVGLVLVEYARLEQEQTP